tara:strand:- start:380 stop:928 length:549 start_codon:yes stop_codon:yes gene_type:complete
MIQIEQTPNPNSIRFLSEKTISSIGTEEFQRKDIEKIDNEFVKSLLKIKGIELVLLADKFLSVKKENEISWDAIKPTVISHMNDYFQNNNEPILNKKKKSDNEDLEPDEVVKKIKQVLDTKIRPAVARDGGDIKFKSFKDGVVHVELQGSCSGCPSSLMTLKKGVQNLLCHYIEEVKSVEAL